MSTTSRAVFVTRLEKALDIRRGVAALLEKPPSDDGVGVRRVAYALVRGQQRHGVPDVGIARQRSLRQVLRASHMRHEDEELRCLDSAATIASPTA